MTRLIDADAVMRNNLFTERDRGFLLDAPTIDAVEVVRCKDCKHRYGDECPMRYVEWVTYDDDGYIEYDDVVHDHTMDDGFCNCGAKMGGDTK